MGADFFRSNNKGLPAPSKAGLLQTLMQERQRLKIAIAVMKTFSTTVLSSSICRRGIAHIVDMEISQHAGYIGKTLEELAWREQYGVNIAYITRGDQVDICAGRHV